LFNDTDESQGRIVKEVRGLSLGFIQLDEAIT